MEEMPDVDVLRSVVAEAEAEAFELADTLSASIRATPSGRGELVALAANYEQLRVRCRALRQALRMAVAG